jgi:hypothetical protein
MPDSRGFFWHWNCAVPIWEGGKSMQLYVWSLVILGLLGVSPGIASEEKKNDTQSQFDMTLEIQPAPQRYTFQNYLADLTELARVDQPARDNPVRELEARKEHRYEPLNPIVIRW